jgi:hypothetical protein
MAGRIHYEEFDEEDFDEYERQLAVMYASNDLCVSFMHCENCNKRYQVNTATEKINLYGGGKRTNSRSKPKRSKPKRSKPKRSKPKRSKPKRSKPKRSKQK